MPDFPHDQLDSEPDLRSDTGTGSNVRERIRYHRTYVLLAGLILILSGILQIDPRGRVVIPGIGLPLPDSCLYLRFVGTGCPGCGLTRSFISLAHGAWTDAWNYNPSGLLFFLLVAAQLPYHLIQIRRARLGLAEWRPTALSTGIILVLVTALFSQWLWRILA